MSITKKFILSVLAISAVLGLAVTMPLTNQCVNANHRRYSRIYRTRRNHRRIRRTRRFRHSRPRRTRRYYLRFHGKIVGWAFNYRTYKKDQAYINTLGTPRRKRRAHRAVRHYRTHYYHIYMDGYDDGRTNSYRVYKQRLGQLKKAIAANQDDDMVQGTESRKQKVYTSLNDQPTHQHSNSVSTNIAEMKRQTLADINQDRENNGLVPLTESTQLDNIANIRAAQSQTDYNHVDSATGNFYNGEDAYKLGYVNSPSYPYYGENLAQSGIGRLRLTDNTWQHANNGTDMANDTEDALMNHDADEGNGHRANILNRNFQYVGVGANYQLQNPNETYPYRLVEEFAY